MTNILERGDIFFLYRPKLNATSVHSLADVQRFYTVLKPDAKTLLNIRKQASIIVTVKNPDVAPKVRCYV